MLYVYCYTGYALLETDLQKLRDYLDALTKHRNDLPNGNEFIFILETIDSCKLFDAGPQVN